jgi:TnpA family transposase
VGNYTLAWEYNAISKSVKRPCLQGQIKSRQDLRKRIDDQLDRLESTHAFARALFYGQNGQFRYAGK